MASILFDHNENSVQILKSNFRKDIKLSVSENFTYSDHFSVLTEENEFIGVRVHQYLSDLELKGAKAEIKFKDFLDENEIPFLYIGQSHQGIERSNALQDKLKSRRPDFLVNFREIGTLFFDVKCRQKKGFIKSSKKYFHLSQYELEGLSKLSALHIPVWIAFIDEHDISFKSKVDSFYLASISDIKDFYDQLIKKLDVNDQAVLDCIRIPEELITQIDGKSLSFKIGFSKFSDDKVISDFAEKYYAIFQNIRDVLRNYIRNNTVFKSHIIEATIKQTSSFAFRYEVSKILAQMIENGSVIYEPKKPLKLKGEL
jgi:hypothetical protein